MRQYDERAWKLADYLEKGAGVFALGTGGTAATVISLRPEPSTSGLIVCSLFAGAGLYALVPSVRPFLKRVVDKVMKDTPDA